MCYGIIVKLFPSLIAILKHDNLPLRKKAVYYIVDYIAPSLIYGCYYPPCSRDHNYLEMRLHL